jgi:hypothetical protein
MTANLATAGLDPAANAHGELRTLTLDELDLVSGGKDKSWVVSLFGKIFFGVVDDGDGPSFGFACVKPGNTAYCVAF